MSLQERYGGNMMPLLLARVGEENKIMAVRGKGETKRFLESMGFVEGSYHCSKRICR